MDAPITFFCFLCKRAILIGPSKQFYWNIEHSPMETPLQTPQLQNRNKCIPLQPTFSFYIHESWTLGKLYGIILRWYWERLREQIGNLGNLKRNVIGAHWGTLNMLSLLPIDCMKFLFPKRLVTILGQRLMAGAEIWGHSDQEANRLECQSWNVQSPQGWCHMQAQKMFSKENEWRAF